MKNKGYRKKRKDFLINKGWDWIYLAKLWNIDYENDENDENIKVFLENVMRKHFMCCHDKCNCGIKHIARDIRVFAKTLSKCGNSYLFPVWKGISKVKDDYETLRITIPLIGYMWD
jgi:hypothetical protein